MPLSLEPIWPFNRPTRNPGALAVALSLTLTAFPAFSADVSPIERTPSAQTGKALYEQACAFCHGIGGQGDGPDAFYLGPYSAPRPRDLTSGEYKFRSTPSGSLPTDDDLLRTLTVGIPGYMPSFQSLSDMDRRHLVAYLKTLSPAFQEGKAQSLPLLPGPIPATPESIQQGRALYVALDCMTCHSEQVNSPEGLLTQGKLKDRRGLTLHPRDLTNLTSYKNGHSPSDIARTILTGLDGSPMASYLEALEPHPEQVWHLVNYILSLSSP